jgi:fatty acid desaturase
MENLKDFFEVYLQILGIILLVLALSFFGALTLILMDYFKIWWIGIFIIITAPLAIIILFEISCKYID